MAKKNKSKLENNQKSFWLAMISSAFLFITGTTGLASWEKIQEFVMRYINFPFLYLIFIFILIFASLGFISVLIGGFFILNKKKFWGTFLIALGAGAGIISFLFNLFISIMTFNFSLYSFLSFSSLGVIFAVLAQYYATKRK